MTSARDIKDALHQRYNKPSQGHNGERYVCIEEARSGAGFGGNTGQCDFLAVNTWQGRGMEILGHEIKVSMSDWRHELEQPDKAELFAKHCRRWFVVMPAALAVKVKEEVPPAWGLLSVSEKGRVTELVKAKAREPEPVPPWWWIGWLAQIDRQHKRMNSQAVAQQVSAQTERVRAEVKRDFERDRSFAQTDNERLHKLIDEFRDATGIDLRHSFRYEQQKLRIAYQLVRSGLDIEPIVGNLRRTADALEQLKDVGGANEQQAAAS